MNRFATPFAMEVQHRPLSPPPLTTRRVPMAAFRVQVDQADLGSPCEVVTKNAEAMVQ